jgi:transcriptional regulator with XRE-family HTH domain
VVSEPDPVAAMRRDLGRQLAALRRRAGLTQQDLGERTGYTRSAVSFAEIGRAKSAREFWQACDRILHADGTLIAGFDQVEAARESEQLAAARLAQAAREARALTAFAAARHEDQNSARVSGGHECPHCGQPLVVITTVLPRPGPSAAGS